MSKTTRVEMQIKDVPAGTLITKRTGEKQYIVRDKLTIWTDGSGPNRSRYILPKEGYRLMEGKDGVFNESPLNKVVAAYLTHDQIQSMIKRPTKARTITVSDGNRTWDLIVGDKLYVDSGFVTVESIQ